MTGDQTGARDLPVDPESPVANPPSAGGSGSVRRRWGFRLMAVCLSLVPLIALECAFRFFQVGEPSSYEDPFVGFSQVSPLFDLDPETAEYRTAKAHLSFFGPERFAAKKPAGGFRGFCLGGSTVLGHPYQPDTAFAKWLELELSALEPERAVEMVNCGGTSYASYRLLPILQEVLQYEPDVIVLMTGHNEFLEDRTYNAIKKRSAAQVWLEDQLHSLHTVTLARQAYHSLFGSSGESRSRAGSARTKEQKTILKPQVDARLDYGSGYASYRRDPVWWQGVTEHFRHNLHAVVKLCREAAVPLVVINPGANLRDCPPFKSEHGSDFDPLNRAAWTKVFEQASHLESQNPAGALTLYRQAKAMDGEHAQLVYRIARCLDRLGRFDEAQQAYVRAKDLDICPLRILEPMHETLFEVARATGTPLVDARSLLEKRSPQGIAGFNCYVDHVHPSIRGHQLIAEGVTQVLQGLKIVNGSAHWGRRERRKANRLHLQTLGDLYFAQGRARLEFLDHWARRDRLRSDTVPLDARGYRDLARAHLGFGESSQAQDAYRRALKLAPESLPQVLDDALELLLEGRPRRAREVARLVSEQSTAPDAGARAQLALAVLALEEGQRADAATLYKDAHARLEKTTAEDHPWLSELPAAFEILANMDRSASENR
jgi:tetratricopeptide (TPR) repeat protein